LTNKTIGTVITIKLEFKKTVKLTIKTIPGHNITEILFKVALNTMHVDRDYLEYTLVSYEELFI
jgi:hypothetical protein